MRPNLRSAVVHGATMAAGAACALLLATGVRGRPLPFTGPPALDGYVAARAEGVTVHASSASAAAEGRREVSAARARFRAHFGDAPPGLVVVLVDDPAEFARLDLAPLSRRGEALLPFVTPAHLDSYADASSTLVLDEGSVLREVDGVVQVVGRTAAEARPGMEIRVGDILVAVEGGQARRLPDVAARFDALVVGDTVRVQVLRDRRPVSLSYVKGQADIAAEHAYRASTRPLSQTSPLAHEACHLYVSALAERAAPARPRVGDGYGHPLLPDWLDEASATLCESAEGRRLRRMHFRARLDRRIPLRTFVRMGHPTQAAHHVAVADSAPEAYRVEIAADEASRRQAVATRTVLFYSQALSLAEFLSERGGPGVLRALIPPLVEGRPFEDALAEARRAWPGLPASVDALEREWLRWVQNGNDG